MRCLSLFAGIGGFDLALERAGIEVVCQVEIDEFCQKVLGLRWPGTERAKDVRTYRTDDVRLAAGEPGRQAEPGRGADADGRVAGRIDLIVGGFPCQDLSVAGKRAGLAGGRSGLFWEICRIAEAERPAWLVLENVPGLLSSNSGRDFGVVLSALRELGYVVGWRVLDSRYFGVAQRRRRVFIVAGPTEAGVRAVLAQPEGKVRAVYQSGDAAYLHLIVGVPCPACPGDGADCPTCGGTGVIP